MTTYRIDAGTTSVLKYENPTEAYKMGNFGCLVSSEEELINGRCLMTTMIDLYNKAKGNPSKAIAFDDRTKLAKLLWPELDKLSTMGKTLASIVAKAPKKEVKPSTPNEAHIERGVLMAKRSTAKKPTATKAPAKAVTKTAPKAARPGRASAFAGKKIYLTKKTNGENVRKKGTQGYDAMEIVRKNPGITYEDFAAKVTGAIPAINHLKWDLEKGNYELK